MRSITRAGNQKGFSLIELLIAVTLLAIGLMAVAGMQTTSIRSNDIANDNTEVASLAQQAMEDLLALSGTHPMLQTAATIDYDLDPQADGSAIIVPGSGTFDATCTITPNTPVAAVTRINITVKQQNSPRSFSLIAYKRVE